MKLVFCLVCILLILLLNKYKEEFYNSSNPKTRVAICFFGLTRSLKHTIDSINTNIFQPLKNSNIEYDVFLHTYKQ